MKIRLLFCLFWAHFTLSAQSLVTLDQEDALFMIGRSGVAFYEPPAGSSMGAILNPSTKFDSHTSDFFSVGPQKSIWIKWHIDNRLAQDAYIEVMSPLVTRATLYTLQQGAVIDTQDIQSNNNRLAAFPNVSNPIFKLKSGEKNTYMLHISTEMPSNIKVRVGTYKSLFQAYHANDLLQGLFAGAALVFILYNFFVFLQLRDRVYLIYSLYLLFTSLYIFRYNGLLTGLLGPNSIVFQHVTALLPGLVGILALTFNSLFLETKKHLPQAHRLFRVMQVVFGVYAVATLLDLRIATIESLSFLLYLGLGLVFICAVLVLKKGQKTAPYSLFGLSVLGIGFTLFLMENAGILPYHPLIVYALQVGLVLEALTMALAVANRFSLMKTKTEDMQASMIKVLNENKQFVQEQNRLLEQKVEERTQELQIALQKVHESEIKLQEYAQRLENSNRELTDFAHIASHDLKAPLRGILSFAQLFERRNKAKFDDTDAEYFNFIKSNAQQSAKLIEDLLNYSKIDKNLGDPTDVNLNDCVFLAETNLKTLILEKNADIQVENLPILRGHTSLLTQLFQNLIGNGIKYNQSPQPKIRVGMQTQTDGEAVYFVKDNGIGIAPENQEVVFTMFRRLHAQTEYEGTGIGLSFCTRIVKTYGGKLWLDSTVGNGTTFYFTLPYAKPSALEKATDKTLPEPIV